MSGVSPRGLQPRGRLHDALAIELRDRHDEFGVLAGLRRTSTITGGRRRAVPTLRSSGSVSTTCLSTSSAVFQRVLSPSFVFIDPDTSSTISRLRVGGLSPCCLTICSAPVGSAPYEPARPMTAHIVWAKSDGRSLCGVDRFPRSVIRHVGSLTWFLQQEVHAAPEHRAMNAHAGLLEGVEHLAGGDRVRSRRVAAFSFQPPSGCCSAASVSTTDQAVRFWSGVP